MSLSQFEDWVAVLSCRPLAVIVMHPLTRNPNYNSMKPCECMDLCRVCVCKRGRKTEGWRGRAFSTCVSIYEREKSERDDERLRLNHISKFGMSSDQRTAMVGEEKGESSRVLFSLICLYYHFLSFKMTCLLILE